MSRRRTLLYLPMPPSIHIVQHTRTCLDYAAGQRLDIVTTASQESAVLDAAEAGLVDVVLAACRWRGSHLDEIEPRLVGLGVRLAVARDQRRERVRITTDPTAARLLALGLTAEQVSGALGVPLEQVQTVAAVATPTIAEPDRRPARTNVVDLATHRTRRVG